MRNPVPSTVFSSRATRRVVVEIGDRSRSEVVGQLGRGLAQLSLFSRQTDVHRRSFSTRRNTFPEGSRGISGTNTTRLGRL